MEDSCKLLARATGCPGGGAPPPGFDSKIFLRKDLDSNLYMQLIRFDISHRRKRLGTRRLGMRARVSAVARTQVWRAFWCRCICFPFPPATGSRSGPEGHDAALLNSSSIINGVSRPLKRSVVGQFEVRGIEATDNPVSRAVQSCALCARNADRASTMARPHQVPHQSVW